MSGSTLICFAGTPLKRALLARQILDPLICSVTIEAQAGSTFGVTVFTKMCPFDALCCSFAMKSVSASKAASKRGTLTRFNAFIVLLSSAISSADCQLLIHELSIPKLKDPHHPGMDTSAFTP